MTEMWQYDSDLQWGNQMPSRLTHRVYQYNFQFKCCSYPQGGPEMRVPGCSKLNCSSQCVKKNCKYSSQCEEKLQLFLANSKLSRNFASNFFF